MFRASVLLQFQAKMCPPSWPALGECVPGRSKPAGSCWPKHPVASGTSRGTDAMGVSSQGRSLLPSPAPTLGLGWSPQVKPRYPPSARPRQGDPKPVSLTQPAWPQATPLPLLAVLLGALPPTPENHLRCYLMLFALLKLLMVFCNQKKTGD